jgi:hypothetical protein
VFILIDDANRPVMLVGEIFPQSSQGRESPPGCYCGFETLGTAFARGHMMALELGGCDDSENIVPQYGQWQGNQNGAWRKMEKAVYEANPTNRTEQQVMVVVVDYPVCPMIDDGVRLAFAMGQKLLHFVDPRIPNRFKVWRLPKSWSSGSVSFAGFFGAADKSKLFEPLFKALGAVATAFDETITEMPAIDRDYWKAQMLNAKVREAYERYAAEQRKKLDEWLQEQTGSKGGGTGGKIRAPRRAAAMARASAMPYTSGPKPADPLNLAKWAQDQKNREKVVEWLKGPPAQLSGWNSVELAALQQQHIDDAVFA